MRRTDACRCLPLFALFVFEIKINQVKSFTFVYSLQCTGIARESSEKRLRRLFWNSRKLFQAFFAKNGMLVVPTHRNYKYLQKFLNSLFQPKTMDFEAVAAQLRKPEGDFGKKVGENMNATNEKMNRTAIDVMRLEAADTVLEIGMGNGAFCEDILQIHPTIRYTGCDFSETMVAEARDRNQKWINVGQADFLLTDAVDLPLEANSFTKAFTVNTLYFWPEPPQILVQLRRVLKPGGTLVIGIRPRTVMDNLPFVQYGFRTYTAHEVETLLQANGFTHTEIREFSEPDQEIDGQFYKMGFAVISGKKATESSAL